MTNFRRGSAFRLLLVLTLIALVSAPILFAGANRWTSSGSLGGHISSLAIDPTSLAVYAATGRSILKSRDGGRTWTTSLAIFSGDDPFVGAIAIDPTNYLNVYAGTTEGVFKSSDAGGSWRAAGPDLSDPRVFSLTLDPNSPSIVLAGTAGGLFKSSDSAGSWSGQLLAASIYNLAFSNQTPHSVFAADFDATYYPNNSHLFRSTDGGASWSQGPAVSDIPPGALAIDPRNPSILYAGSFHGHIGGTARPGLFRSADNGQTWQLMAAGGDVTAFVADPTRANTLYAATSSGFLQSTDGGATWIDFSTGWNHTSTWVTAMTIDRSGQVLYAGTDSGELFSYVISSTGVDQAAAVDVSVGSNNETRTVFSDPDRRTVFRSYDNSGASTSIGPQGPYTRWVSRAAADGKDGLTRVLWNKVDGSAALWLLGPTGNQASYLYAPAPGWTAVDVSVGSDGATHLLWTNIDGRTKLTSVALSGAVLAEATYGPFAGWIARSISDGADGLTRLLWTGFDGRAGLSLIDSTQIVATFRFSRSGWTARDVAVASDNRARILFEDKTGQMSLWSVDNSGVVTNSTDVYTIQQSALEPARVAAGADGLTRVLWKGDGFGSMWLMNSDNSVRSSFLFCGDFGKTLGCGYWDY